MDRNSLTHRDLMFQIEELQPRILLSACVVRDSAPGTPDYTPSIDAALDPAADQQELNAIDPVIVDDGSSADTAADPSTDPTADDANAGDVKPDGIFHIRPPEPGEDPNAGDVTLLDTTDVADPNSTDAAIDRSILDTANGVHLLLETTNGVDLLSENGQPISDSVSLADDGNIRPDGIMYMSGFSRGGIHTPAPEQAADEKQSTDSADPAVAAPPAVSSLPASANGNDLLSKPDDLLGKSNDVLK